MNVRLSDRAHDGIADYARENHVTVAALFEALGEMLADGVERLIDASVVERAAAIKRERVYRGDG